MAQTLLERYRVFNRNTGTSDRVVSQNIGFSQTVISQWLNGKYTGNTVEVEKALTEFLNVQDDRVIFGKITVPFVATENAKMISAVIRRAQLDKNIALIIGDSGTGKTYGIENWVNNFQRSSILIRVNVTFNPKILISELHKVLGLGGHGSKNSMLTDCIKTLKDTDRVVIIDEADLLSVASIEMMRALHDESGIGIVMLGLPEIAEAVRGSRGELARINTRIANFSRLKSLSIEDTASITSTLIPDSDAFAKVFYTLSKGNGRVLGNLLKNVVRVHKETNHEITNKFIEKCFEMQHR